MSKEVKVHDKTFRLLIDSDDIQKKIKELAARINKDYDGQKPLFVGVMNGAFLFIADLLKRVTLECELTFVRVKSYEGTSSTGVIRNLAGLDQDISNRDVIIVEDIVDTGETLKYLIGEVLKHQPKTIRIATLVFKPEAMKYPIKIDYIGFEVPRDFLVGYGLDYDGLGRNLTSIYTLR